MSKMNDRAGRIADEMEARAADLRLITSRVGGVRIIDCGVGTRGGLEAGLMMARACLSDLAHVDFAPSDIPELSGPIIAIRTDDPVRACLASQYAGQQFSIGSFSGMGSGPIRAIRASEPLFQVFQYREECDQAVAVIESRRLPTEDVVERIVATLPETVKKLTLIVAPVTSLAGTVQVVARSVETALHKLHELKYDVSKIVSAYGSAPLPPVSPVEITAFGRVNDAILYGGRVVLWVDDDDAALNEIGPKVPSISSHDFGKPFAELFAAYGDFYKIDPLLFSPAEVTLISLRTGHARIFGSVAADLLRKSFFGEGS